MAVVIRDGGYIWYACEHLCTCALIRTLYWNSTHLLSAHLLLYSRLWCTAMHRLWLAEHLMCFWKCWRRVNHLFIPALVSLLYCIIYICCFGVAANPCWTVSLFNRDGDAAGAYIESTKKLQQQPSPATLVAPPHWHRLHRTRAAHVLLVLM